MILVPAIMDHYESISPREWDAKLLVLFDPRPLIQRGPAFTLISDRGIVGIAGVYLMWKGVGEAWAITTKLIEKYPKAAHRATKDVLETLQRNKRLHRVQCAVLEDHPTSHEWVKRLGFKREGKMVAYGPSRENFIRYARVRRWHH